MIEFKDVTKVYGDQTVLKDLNLTINAGELYVLVGPSGSGKTTSVKMINQLIKPTSGTIKIDGKDINDYDLRKLRLGTGYVLQNIALFPNLNIQDNIVIQLEELKVPKEERIERARDLLEQVGLEPDKYAERMPDELSGGEQQRVGITRALATNPNIILMDEAFSALDPISRKQLQDIVLELHAKAKYNMTIVFVTHDMREALRLGTRIAIINQGELQQVGTQEEILNQPANDFVKSFFKGEQETEVATAGKVIIQGYGHKSEDSDDVFRVSFEDELPALISAVREHKQVRIVFHDANYLLTIDDVLDFIENKEAANE
ncbi:ABC transporter ATP-binding protein [Companilactobacillus mishanensis]|uniref:ABC-type quaternary amine transporter n=1 Tax=Companilactobacillus mishanensis TaxID=2486008 RepID=A0A5P0ZG81_9LACO|nr:ABC transporter ATP-binding protein [Companilactobacillus mishanensis]MQS52063.1 ABC transporter ATP-binding protein [Companilactobacillus mishanensis]MQS90260.1 ABC transporter ATP-binding protein [Companilactobacillus mishanensis]